jgi:D-glycero-alpha-D-manno-heptose-7-phosphate kinase
MGKHELARRALFVEQDVLKEAVGSQDQVAAAYGGFNRLDFFPDDSFSVTPVILSRDRKEDLQDHLLLFFTGFQRNAVEVARKKIDNFKIRQNELRTMQALVEEAMKMLLSHETPISELGNLLHETWMIKRSMAEGVSTPVIDEIYETARAAGAIGGKILGAGGGGFMLFLAKPQNHAQIRKSLAKLVHVDFRFESGGSKIVLYDPNF